ncbi:MFS transporter [Bifidobacterium apicola]|uniref:MFS transporter n=1 Tax=Bifidobacterium apicola TaxID=3230739 RepID=UPI0036F27C92
MSAVFLTTRGLDHSEIFRLESVILLSIFLVEVPSGVWADKVDRKAPIILGLALSAASNMIYALGQGFAWYALSYSMSGFSIALLSGILEAYVYEFLCKDADKLATGVFGFYKSLEFISGVLASLCGSYLAHLNISFPAYTTAVVSFIGFLFILRLPSIPENNRKHSTSERSFMQDLTKGASVLIRTPVLAFVSITSSAPFVL